MLPETRGYLEEVRSHLHLDRSTQRLVMAELSSYFEEKIGELRQTGLSEREASRVAIEACGRPRVIAQRMYEAHSRGSMSEAGLASLPHLIVAYLFASHLWREPLPAILAFSLIAVVTLYAWWHGKPSWLYPWVSYSLAPLLIGGWAVRPVLGQAIAFVTNGAPPPSLPILLIVTAFMLISAATILVTTVRVAQRDWILASLMLVALPLVGGWMVSLEENGGLFRGASTALQQSDGAMTVALLSLAVTSACFVVVRQRVLKIGALAVVGTIAAAMVGHSFWGDRGFFGLVGTSLLLLLFILSPILINTESSEEEIGQISEAPAP